VELRQVRLFVAVAEDCHFGRAAERMCIAQPALSQHIRRLERELGVRLFDRSSRRVRLTPAGAAFLDGARRMLAHAEEAARGARLAEQGRAGSITIALDPVAAAGLLPAALQRWATIRPTVRPTLVAGRRPELLDLARRREVDVVLLEGPLTDAALQVDVLEEHDAVVLLPAGHRLVERAAVEFSDLRDESFVFVDRTIAPGLHDRTIAECDAAGFSPRIELEVRGLELVPLVVASGTAVAVVGRNHVADRATAGVEARPVGSIEALTSLAIARGRHDAPRQAVEFVALVLELTHCERAPERASYANVA